MTTDTTMPHRDDNLFNAMKPYTLEAVRLTQSLLSTFPAGELRLSARDFAGIPAGRGRSRITPWHMALIRTEQQRHALPEYATCLARLAENPRAVAQIGKSVGDGELQSPREARDLADAILFDLPISGDSADVSDATFETVYRDFEDDLYSEIIRAEVIIPLGGFTSDAETIPLGDSISITRFSWNEISHIPQLFIPKPIAGPVVKFAIRARYHNPKVVGEASEDQRARARDQSVRALEAADRVLLALAVFKAGSVIPLATITHSRSVPGVAQCRQHPVWLFATLRPTYSLSELESQKLTEFWRALTAICASKHQNLVTALRRFAFANERTRVEDGIVDLAIAGEALLLDEPKYRGEIKYRFAINAALLGAADTRPSEMFRLFATAYDLRSNLVHGGGAVKPKLPDGRQVDLWDFGNYLEARLRDMLQRAVAKASDTSAPKLLYDWSALLMERLDRPADASA